jgi:hypothetical protein
MSPENVTINYLTLSLYNHEFIESSAVAQILSDNPNLIVVRAESGEDGEEIWKEIALPVDNVGREAPNRCIGILDKEQTDPESNLLRIHDFDEAFIKNPSEAFIKILKLMEKEWDAVKINMFSNYSDPWGMDTSVWGEVFDFTTGNYKPNTSKFFPPM